MAMLKAFFKRLQHAVAANGSPGMQSFISVCHSTPACQPKATKRMQGCPYQKRKQLGAGMQDLREKQKVNIGCGRCSPDAAPHLSLD